MCAPLVISHYTDLFSQALQRGRTLLVLLYLARITSSNNNNNNNKGRQVLRGLDCLDNLHKINSKELPMPLVLLEQSRLLVRLLPNQQLALGCSGKTSRTSKTRLSNNRRRDSLGILEVQACSDRITNSNSSNPARHNLSNLPLDVSKNQLRSLLFV